MGQSTEPLASLRACTDWVVSGCKPRSAFRIGTEYERFAIDAGGTMLPYDGAVSIHTLFERLQARGWRPYLEAGRPIALFRDGASISLEPAGQFELSGAPQPSITAMRDEMVAHLAEMKAVAHDLGVALVHAGLHPYETVDGVPKMPKGRYGVMRQWMPTVGTLGLDMMHLTCTVQANLDFETPEEAIELVRLGFLLGPVLIALFANSSRRHGSETGYATFRAHLWTDVDRARCDASRFAYDPAATVQDYVDWALDVPVYFLDVPNPDGSHGYRAMDGKTTFRDFFTHGVDGRRPTLADWELHASTLFPDIRLKRYVEVRQADCVPPEALPALPALCKGLFYDVTARRDALALLRDGDHSLDRAALRELACRSALDGQLGDVDLRQWAGAALALARQGLARLEAEMGPDPAAALALDVLDAIVAGERLPFWRATNLALDGRPSLASLPGGW